MEKYYDLIMGCPCKECVEVATRTGIQKDAQWYHAGCGGKVQIGYDAYIRCVYCGEKDHVKNWRFAPQEHETDYRTSSSNHFAAAISLAAQVTPIAGRLWLQEFLNNMGDW